ncbi:Phosphatase YwpJ [Streptomyces sp. RB5]|uniref:Phosphatase YwpJ n=1 Tax=Streptomyces smaragdinus TaxID=2585196 RepID=A0A7K0CM42_9ACTN|nr:HAD family hydrolase [Streptomyces smaragdinus]MQY13844.1 Phosphatase YwpJ [Streptomyces smaragdinus]
MSSAAPFPYRLIATDLDGTLLRSDGSISGRTREALRAAAGRGAAHIVVTGRAVPWVRHVLDDLEYDGLAVCGQGAQLYDARAHRLLTTVTLDRAVARAALEKIEADTGPLAVAASMDGLQGETLFERRFRTPAGVLGATFVSERAELWNAPLGRMYIQHPTLTDDELTAAATAAVGPLLSVVLAGEDTVELLPAGLSKATGLSLAARRLEVPGSAAIAFGDMPNDLPMFRWAGRSVAMANAHADVRAAADEVTASNDEDGVAVVVERLLLGG